MAIKRSSEFLRLGIFLVILDTILNSKMQKSLLLQFVPPQSINALDYFPPARLDFARSQALLAGRWCRWTDVWTSEVRRRHNGPCPHWCRLVCEVMAQHRSSVWLSYPGGARTHHLEACVGVKWSHTGLLRTKWQKRDRLTCSTRHLAFHRDRPDRSKT